MSFQFPVLKFEPSTTNYFSPNFSQMTYNNATFTKTEQSQFDTTGKYVSGYLSEEGLKNLKHYKYCSSASGYLDREWMNPFWEKCLLFLPLWLAPNLITIISLAHAFVAEFLMLYFCPSLTEEAPRWVYFTCALCMFLYQTFDALDGKQARRTKSSSPLGQLFDHKCDAICTVLTALILCATMQTGATSLAIVLFFLTIIPFFMSNWEESNTGVMRFGVVGVTEAQFLIMIILLVTAFFGPGIWHKRLYLPILGCYFTVRILLVWCSICAVLHQSFVAISVVFSHYDYRWKEINKINKGNATSATDNSATKDVKVNETDNSKTKDNQVSNFHQQADQAVNQLNQFFIFVACSSFWLWTVYNNLFQEMPQLIFATIGCWFALQVSWLILAHFTKDAYPSFDIYVYLLSLMTLLALVLQNPLINRNCFLLYSGMIFCRYVHFIFVSIRQITTFLGIRCFQIKKI